VGSTPAPGILVEPVPTGLSITAPTQTVGVSLRPTAGRVRPACDRRCDAEVPVDQIPALVVEVAAEQPALSAIQGVLTARLLVAPQEHAPGEG
jgi:hypothetical protein